MRTTTPATHRLLAAVLALAFLLPGSARAAAPGPGPADLLVDSVLKAYGGREALAKVAAYRMEGSVSSVMSGTGALVRTFARPDRLKIALDYPGRPETRILDGAQGWRSDAQRKLAPADGFLLTSMVLQAARANLPWLLDERRGTLKLLAPIEEGKIQVLEAPLGQGLTLTVYVESASGRIVRSAGVLTSADMSTNFATDYADFRTVNGVLFPFREANFASNRSTGETIVTKVVVNPPLTRADFRP